MTEIIGYGDYREDLAGNHLRLDALQNATVMSHLEHPMRLVTLATNEAPRPAFLPENSVCL